MSSKLWHILDSVPCSVVEGFALPPYLLLSGEIVPSSYRQLDNPPLAWPPLASISLPMMTGCSNLFPRPPLSVPFLDLFIPGSTSGQRHRRATDMATDMVDGIDVVEVDV